MSEPQNKTIVPAVKALIRNEKREIFFIKHTIPGGKQFWSIPGGRVNYGESPYNTLEREVLEEIGAEVERGKPLGMYHFFRERDGLQVVLTVFDCKLKPEQKIDFDKNPDEEEEINEFLWMSIDEFLAEDREVGDPSFIEFLKSL